MSTTFASMLTTNWPVLLDTHGEDAVYLAADGSETALTVVATGKAEALALDDTWETAAKQVEIFAAVSEAPATFTIREDTITIRGQSFTVLDRADNQGAVYRYLCERIELTDVVHRGRRY